MDEKFWNQWPWVIRGAEGEGDGNDDSSDDDGNDDGDDGSDDSDDSSDGQNAEGNQSEQEDRAKLQKALAAERRLSRKLDRENRRLKAGQQNKENQETEDLEKTRNDLAETRTRAEKLAAGLLKRDINAAIEKAARKAKFIDVEDAINGVDRTKIVADQDDEDPTDIDIDFDTVEAAVKELASKKPHFLTTGTDDGDATGSSFGGSKKRKPTSEEALKELYPSL